MVYMLDTNIVSYLLEGNEEVRNRLFAIVGANEIVLPEMVYYEIERGLFAHNAKNKLSRFEAFCELFPICFMTRESILCAARIYADLKKRGQLIEDADIFIGASALASGAVLVTNNEEHLGRIDGLCIENWAI